MEIHTETCTLVWRLVGTFDRINEDCVEENAGQS